MSGKPKSMNQIKQLILFRQQGKGKKTIARLLGMSKNTVKVYLDKLEALTQDKDSGHLSEQELLNLELPILEAKFHPGNAAYKDERFERFKIKADYYLEELTRVGVTKQILWQEYREENKDSYSYSQFCFHINQHRLAAKPSMVLEHKPAEKLFIDFAGKKLSYIDKDTGEEVSCQVFVACLPYSDYCFAMAVKSQSTEDFLYALSCCLQDLGGVPKALVPDNLKAAVVKANRYEPTINTAMEDFANHYQATVLPTRARKPQDKALVENQVKLIYSRVYAKLRNMQFFDLHSLNTSIKAKVKAHNQTRMQQKGYCREEKFLGEEKPLLCPLPKERFELKSYTTLTVAKNNHVYLSEDKNYYSVPFHLIGSKVKVIYTINMVYVFSKGEQVALHIRSYKHGSYTTTKDHLCSQHQHYRDRSPTYYKDQARRKSTSLYDLITLVFDQNRYPEQLYRTCDGLFGLHRKTEALLFDKACRIAIEYQNYSYTFVKNILENKMAEQEETIPDQSLPEHDNVRGKAYYQQSLPLKFNK